MSASAVAALDPDCRAHIRPVRKWGGGLAVAGVPHGTHARSNPRASNQWDWRRAEGDPYSAVDRPRQLSVVQYSAAVAYCGVEENCWSGRFPRVRNRDAAGSPSRASKHPETATRARRRLQLGAAAAPDPRRHAAQPSAPGGGPVSCLDQPIARPVRLCETFLDALSVDLVANGVFTARSTPPDHLHECEDFHLRLLGVCAAGRLRHEMGRQPTT